MPCWPSPCPLRARVFSGPRAKSISSGKPPRPTGNSGRSTPSTTTWITGFSCGVCPALINCSNPCPTRMYQLSAADFHLRVDPIGAELTSLRYRGVEYLWQADPAVWGRHAPVLFPIVGRLKDDRYQHQGQWYEMKQHGFARNQTFALLSQSADALAFRLTDNDDTRAQYPFSFVLDISYTVSGSSLTVGYRVHNPGPEPMPFSIGAHPGFRLPLEPDTQIEGYAIVFDQRETAETHLIEDGLFDGRTAPCLEESDRIPWRTDLFDADALVFHHLRSREVALVSPSGQARVTVTLEGFPYLGIWAKPGAPYVCLEPWQGLADYTSASGDLRDKAGIMLLTPGTTHVASYDIRLG
ncbi:MAG: aldose 1-epimerase family protein [Bacteroidetes bacterium]|nr:MAG: aldose 1-epimerase family protein [Bacteroidota bacterium]